VDRTREQPALEWLANANGYSDLRLSTGLASAALIDWKLIVSRVIRRMDTPAMTNEPGPI
jgi:hypothetical protein